MSNGGHAVGNGENINPINPFGPNSYDLLVISEFSDCKVRYRERNKIGQGHYGTVYRGELEYNDKDRLPEQVAIKKLKTLQVSNDFIREIEIMRKLDHPNVVKFKYWAEKSMSIIMEYFEFGSFIVYLSSHKPNLTNDRLLAFALDIALVSLEVYISHILRFTNYSIYFSFYVCAGHGLFVQ